MDVNTVSLVRSWPMRSRPSRDNSRQVVIKPEMAWLRDVELFREKSEGLVEQS